MNTNVEITVRANLPAEEALALVNHLNKLCVPPVPDHPTMFFGKGQIFGHLLKSAKCKLHGPWQSEEKAGYSLPSSVEAVVELA